MASSLIRRISLSAARRGGVYGLLRRVNQGPTVLFYHGIEEKLSDPEVQSLHLPLASFERHIRYLRRHREIISTDYLYDCLMNGHRLDPRQVVLTFDDGYKNNAEILAPFLKGWDLPFTVFISTRHVLEGRRFQVYLLRTAFLYTEHKVIHLASIQRSFEAGTPQAKRSALREASAAMKEAPLRIVEWMMSECRQLLRPERWAELDQRFASDEPMNWQDVIRIQSMGATIGSHCHDHCILHSEEPPPEVRSQVMDSKRVIEQQFGECKFLAYPNGTARDISATAYQSVREARYRMCFTTIEGEITAKSDLYYAPRVFAQPGFEEFCYMLNRTGTQNESYDMACRSFQSGNAVSAAANRI